MKDFLAGLRRWWLRKFRGIVAPPRQFGGQGTTWQQHRAGCEYFNCVCGFGILFSPDTYVVRSQDHVDGCPGYAVIAERTVSTGAITDRCGCPVTDARYVKICPSCKRGHWKQAEISR